MRRVAALYDIHANLPALEAVLAEAGEADLVVVGGDFSHGPMPAETVDRLRALGERVRFIRGNADRIAVGEGRWKAGRLGAERVEFLAGLPETAAVEIDGLGGVLFCHGSPRSDEEIITAVTPPERLERILAGVSEPVVVCGHTHHQFALRSGTTRVVNAGSVGMPYEGRPGAFWAMLGPDVEHRSTAYDLDAAEAAVRATGFPGADELVDTLRHPAAADDVARHFESLATG
ncbi:MAG TPA: metallophosphoesterase family protein [Gaiellales bacterium]|nr:metallophosphoesterase family protein [Gaiellales bacterium]